MAVHCCMSTGRRPSFQQGIANAPQAGPVEAGPIIQPVELTLCQSFAMHTTHTPGGRAGGCAALQVEPISLAEPGKAQGRQVG